MPPKFCWFWFHFSLVWCETKANASYFLYYIYRTSTVVVAVIAVYFTPMLILQRNPFSYFIFGTFLFQCTVLQKFKEAIFNEEETPQALKPVLLKLCSLYGLSSMETHLTTLYQGQCITGIDC